MPSHAWFVVGIRVQVVEKKAKVKMQRHRERELTRVQEVATMSETWIPSFLE